MILLADRVCGNSDRQLFLGGMDVSVQRNYFGSQVASTVTAVTLSSEFKTELMFDDDSKALDAEGPPSGLFIRAPAYISLGPLATGLAWVTLPSSASNATPVPVCVAARQGPLLGTAFHPELTPQRCFHRLFVRMVKRFQTDNAIEGASGERYTSTVSTTLAVRTALHPSTEPIQGSDCGAPAKCLADIALPLFSAGSAVAPLTPGTSAASSYRSQGTASSFAT